MFNSPTSPSQMHIVTAFAIHPLMGFSWSLVSSPGQENVGRNIEATRGSACAAHPLPQAPPPLTR